MSSFAGQDRTGGRWKNQYADRGANGNHRVHGNRDSNTRDPNGISGRSGQGVWGRRGRRQQDQGPPEIEVGNLPFAVNRDDLMLLFGPLGAVDAEILMNKSGRSLGKGRVTFQSLDAMQAAVAKKKDAMFRGRSITIRKCRQRKRSNKNKNNRNNSSSNSNSINGESNSGRDFNGSMSPPRSPKLHLDAPYEAVESMSIQERSYPGRISKSQTPKQQQKHVQSQRATSGSTEATEAPNHPLPEAAFFFDPPPGSTSFRLVPVPPGSTFKRHDIPPKIEDMLFSRSGPRMVLCQIVSASSGGVSALASAEDLTTYEDEKGGGGLYHNISINDIGFSSAVLHHLEDACNYDAQVAMHVSFGRIGVVVPDHLIRGNNLISAASLCDGMASGKFAYFFTPMLSGPREADVAAKALLSKAGSFDLVSENTCIDIRYCDGGNCSVIIEQGRVRAVAPTEEEIKNAPPHNPLLHGQTLASRVAKMSLNPETGLISVTLPEGLAQSRDIRAVGPYLIDRQRMVTRRLMKSQSHGLFACQKISRIIDCPDQTIEGYRCHPDIVEVTTSLTRDHLRSMSAAELDANTRFMTPEPPGFPVYRAFHFAGGMSCDARVWLSEIPPDKTGQQKLPWSADIGCMTAYRTLDVTREVCKAVNIACNKAELQKLRRMHATRQRQRESRQDVKGSNHIQSNGMFQ